MEVCWIDKYSVGQKISTKAVGSSERHDLTWDYKYRDGKLIMLLIVYMYRRTSVAQTLMARLPQLFRTS